MHFDTRQLAAYLDGVLDPADHADVRAHLLICATCAARMERLRADAQAISRWSQTGAVPDIHAAVRARRRRMEPLRWLGQSLAFAGIAAVLLLFALLIGARSGGTAGWMPDRLFVLDRYHGELVALNAADGSQMSAIALEDQPSQVLYDRQRDQLFVLNGRGVVAINPQTQHITAGWTAEPTWGAPAAMVFDELRGRLFLCWPAMNMISALDSATLTPASFTADGHTSFQIDLAPRVLALVPDGHTLYTIDSIDSTLWAVNLASLKTTSWSLGPPGDQRTDWLAVSADGQSVYVLRAMAASGDPPELRHVNVVTGQVSAAAPVLTSPPPWDMLLLGEHLAIAHGDGQRGGIELISTSSLSQTAHIDPQYDQHHLVAGSADAVFALNFSHGTITRYDLHSQTVVWRTPKHPWRPWNGVYVPGGWRWPF